MRVNYLVCFPVLHLTCSLKEDWFADWDVTVGTVFQLISCEVAIAEAPLDNTRKAVFSVF
jgi:hypothetical protein